MLFPPWMATDMEQLLELMSLWASTLGPAILFLPTFPLRIFSSLFSKMPVYFGAAAWATEPSGRFPTHP